MPFEDEAPSPPAPARTEKSRKQKAAKKEVGAEVAEEEGEKGEETTPPVRRFGVLALLLVFLGAAGLGAVAASPFLEPGKVASAGEIQKHLPARSVARFEEEATPYVIGAPAAAAGVALLIFLIGLLTRRGGFFPLFLLYLTTLATVAMAWYSLFVFRTETANIVKIRETAAVHRSQGVTGDVTVTEGQQLYAAAGGAGAAALCFFLALLLLHQGALVRFACFVLLGLVIALGPVWIYRHELGLKEYVPPDLEKTIGF